MSEKSREERIQYLLRVAKAILVRAEATVQGDTLYLRDELNHLLESMDVLLEKVTLEQYLRETRNHLHARFEDTGRDASESDGGEDPATGIRPRAPETGDFDR